MSKEVLLCFMIGVVLVACTPVRHPGVQHVEMCPKSEVCPGHPEAICFKDCWGFATSMECGYHFYDDTDTILVCAF